MSMRASITLLGLACYIGITLSTAGTAHKRDEYYPPKSLLRCLYMTEGMNWTGEGLQLCGEIGKCEWHIPDGLAWKVSSAGADLNAVCSLFSDINCAGEQSVPILHGGYSDLGEVGFDNKAVSFKCFNNTAATLGCNVTAT